MRMLLRRHHHLLPVQHHQRPVLTLRHTWILICYRIWRVP
jgi:hypothetical protein